MRIQEFESVYEADGAADVEAVLTKRYSAANAFWLSHGSDKYPVVSILVNGELASLHYFPKECHPGFRSVGTMEGLSPGATATFFMNSLREEVQVLNDSIVPFSLALRAACEFCASTDLPRCVQWFEL
jgi:hypothetical protein